MLKKTLISGIIFSSIFLVACKEDDVVVIDDSKNGDNDVNLSSESESNLLPELQNEIIDSITEQTEIDSESITIMVGGNPDKGIIDVSVGFPKKIKVDDTLIQQIIEDSIKKVFETENVTINEEDITINIEKY